MANPGRLSAILSAISETFAGKRTQPETGALGETHYADLDRFAASRSVTAEQAKRAKEELRVFNLERQILGSALTTIYESLTKGLLNEDEKNLLVGKYKVDLKRLEEQISDRKRIVELFQLEHSRDDLLRELSSKLEEIDSGIKKLRPDYMPPPIPAAPPKPESDREDQKSAKQTTEHKEREREKAPRDEPRNKAEKKIEEIREEVIKAMERLEQIEGEG